MAAEKDPDSILGDDGRSSPIWLVLILALVIATTGTLLAFLRTEDAQPFILGLLALLAVFGIFALFAAAVGLIELTGSARKVDVSHALLQSFPEGALVTDGAGRILYSNDAYLKLTAADGPHDARTLERVYARDPEVAEVLYRLNNAAREGRTLSEDVRIRAGDMQRWLRIRVVPVKSGGHASNYFWTVADITRERSSQEHIVQDLQHAIDYLDHAPAGFMSVDARGGISYMNATLAQLLDYDLADATTGDLSIKDLIQPVQLALFEGLTAKPGEQLTEIYDIDLMKRNGQTCPVRLLHRVSFAADGTQGSSRTLVLDRAPGSAGDDAETLRAAEVRFARFFNNAPLAIATVDRDGHIGRANAHFAKLIPSHAARGSSLLDAIADIDRPQVQAAFSAATKGRGNLAPMDVTWVGDKQRYARLYVSAVDEDERDSEAALVFAVDTTQQRALEIQFAQSQKMQAIGQLAGGIAHDFNNVLTAIIGFSDLLLASHRPTDPAFQDIMNIKQNANRAAGLVRQLLAFSRRQTLRPEVLALPDTLSELSVLLSRLLGEKVKLEVRNGRDLWFVKADINQFEQVIMNLSVNGRDAMPDGGKLTISTQNVKAEQVRDYNYTIMPPTDYVLIEVSDTGTGIPEHVLDKIFEPFFSTKEVGKGTGLGLSTVYGIVKQTDGFIFVETEMGEGTTFRIFLPRYQPRTDEIPVKQVTKDVSADLTGQGTILLVEDEEAVRAFAARALRSRGYTVLEADSGLTALEQMKEHKDEIALVVSDVVMPEMDGPTMLREMRKLKDDLKIIFMSGYAEEAFSKNLDENEKFGFLPKPFSLKQLAAKVKETMVPGNEAKL